MRYSRNLMIASLIVNLFLAGALVGGALWVHRDHRMIAAGALRIAGAELPQAERDAFRAALRDARHSSIPAIEEAHAQRLRAATLLRQPTIDQPAILDALARTRMADMAVRASVEARAVAFASTMPPADRGALADAMEGRFQHRRRLR